jgi:hypothetical protein
MCSEYRQEPEMLRGIPNREESGAAIETIRFSCLSAEEIVYDVMKSPGMRNLEIEI